MGIFDIGPKGNICYHKYFFLFDYWSLGRAPHDLHVALRVVFKKKNSAETERGRPIYSLLDLGPVGRNLLARAHEKNFSVVVFCLQEILLSRPTPLPYGTIAVALTRYTGSISPRHWMGGIPWCLSWCVHCFGHVVETISHYSCWLVSNSLHFYAEVNWNSAILTLRSWTWWILRHGPPASPKCPCEHRSESDAEMLRR